MLGLGLVVTHPGRTQTRQPKLEFERLSVDEGLSNASVISLAQDSIGFIWVATEDGVNRYDGYSFTRFRHDPLDSGSIAGVNFGSLVVDKAGNVWMIGGSVLGMYDVANDRFTHQILPDSALTYDIEADPVSGIWGGTTRGLFRCEAGAPLQWYPAPRDDGRAQASDSIVRLHLDARGTLWFVTIDGWVGVVDDSSSKLLADLAPSGIDGGRAMITAIEDDLRGDIWFGDLYGGLVKFDRASNRFLRPSGTPSQVRWTIAEAIRDRRGRIWFGSFAEGLHLFDPATGDLTTSRFDADDPKTIGGDRVYALMEDRAGAIWIGTWRGGLARYDPEKRKFRHVPATSDTRNSIGPYPVLSFVEDPREDGRLWVGTEGGGIVGLDRSSGPVVRHRHRPGSARSLGGNRVYALLRDRVGTVWAGTEGGLQRADLSNGVFTTIRPDERLGEVKTIYEDADGDIWVGNTRGDFFRLDESRTGLIRVRLPLQESPDGRSGIQDIMSVALDRDRRLWICTFGNGLYRLDRSTGEIRHYLSTNGTGAGLTSPTLYHVSVDDSGTVWVGTFAAGLARYRPESDSFELFDDRDGLPDNFVKAVVPDRRGRIWLSTTRGLSRFDPRARTFRNYDAGDGIQGNEFRSGSCLSAASGEIYFGGVNGYNVFDPDGVRDNERIPPVALTSFKVFDRPYDLPGGIAGVKTIELSFSQDVFSFEFVALNFTNAGKNQYAYMMEGFDRGWIYCGTRRYASYTHLDEGEYVFRVKASNNDGIWNEEGAAVTIVVHPPFWRSWWFRLGTLAVACGALYGIYRYRIRRIVELERLRMRIASDLHDEIGSELTQISIASELLKRKSDDPEARRMLDKVGATAGRAIEAMSDIVWYLDPKRDRVTNLVERIQRMAADLLHAQSISFETRLEPLNAKIQLPPEVKRHLYLLVKEGIHNAVRHSACRTIVLTIRQMDHRLTVMVDDDGRGIPPGTAEGNGLRNMKRRASELGGDLTVGPGSPGTSILFEMPLGRRKPTWLRG